MISTPEMTKSVISIILLLASLSWAVPDCGNEVIVFTSQPRDGVVFEEVYNVAKFHCHYQVGHSQQTRLQWIINSTVYPKDLPSNHQYSRNNHTLSVMNIKHWQNGTTYQCQVLVEFNKGQWCASRSFVGRLIIKGFEVQTSTHYYADSKRQEIMTEIFLSFSQVDSRASYNLVFSDMASGKVCDSDVIPASFCENRACNYVFKVLSSSCPLNTNINITVGVSGSGFSKQIIIDAVNTFIEITFDEAKSSITLMFLNQPKESEKHYTVRYGALERSCRHLPIQSKGHLTNTNYIAVEFNARPESTTVTITDICWSVTVTNGTKTVSIEGIYSFGIAKHTMVVVSASAVVVVTIIVSLLFIAMLYNNFTEQLSNYKGPDGVVYVDKSEHDPVILEPIDLSTTFHKLLPVEQQCSIYEFGKEHFPGYQSERGFGYCKASDDLYPLQNVHKRVIMMNNDRPTHTIVSSAIKQQVNITAKHTIYFQERGYRTLKPHDKFLYCARSKDITKIAYWRIFDVTYECKESRFIEEKFSGYNTDWIRYGYFEMTTAMYLEANQSFIVQKKDGRLFKGPGVQHLLAGQSSSAIVQPPNLEVDHPEWQHIFIQSTTGERQLTPGTVYLFCAEMEWIGYNIHREVNFVNEECTLEEFGRYYNPGFKAELGHGYFEFTEREYLKPQKNVIVMDKEGRLYTGAGAKFFYYNCKYGKEEIERKKKISPPDLKNTDWKHIFVQSHSKDRKLKKGTLFLYCEYRMDPL